MGSEMESRLEMALANLNRVRLGEVNTPLEHLPRFSAALGGPQVYIKRDDLTGLAFGGNKTRMLEYSLAVGVERGADTIVYGAAVQSNYCRQLAAACAKLGITLHLILRAEREIDKTAITGNNLLQRLLGAHVTVLSDNDRDRQQEMPSPPRPRSCARPATTSTCRARPIPSTWMSSPTPNPPSKWRASAASRRSTRGACTSARPTPPRPGWFSG